MLLPRPTQKIMPDQLSDLPMLQVAWSRLLASFKYQELRSRLILPPLVLVRGLPGSGKSTRAASFSGYLHKEADQFFIGDQGEYQFNKEKLRQAHLWCQQETFSALQTGSKVVVSNTFTQPFELHPYFVIASWLGVNVQVLQERGNWQNSHQVPKEVLQAMRDRWHPLEPGIYTPTYCPLESLAIRPQANRGEA